MASQSENAVVLDFPFQNSGALEVLADWAAAAAAAGRVALLLVRRPPSQRMRDAAAAVI
jgi:hypothetical protein